MDCGCCRDELNLDKLCAKKIKACEISVKELELHNTLCAQELSSPRVCTELLMAKKADVNSSCVTDLNVMNECVQNLTAVNLGAVNLRANNLCVSGELKAKVRVCSQYEATAVYSANTTYTLGNLLNFNLILSNSSGALSVAPTTYTAPVSGNYIVMFQIDQQNLIPNPAFGPILGVPVANPQMLLNGIVHRETYSSYLSFFNQQRSTVTALVKLNVGDQLQFKYKVLALQEATGVTEVVGTVDILGNGSTDDQSIVKIELLSVNCENGPILCEPVVPCQPCIPQQCTPCVPGNGNSGNGNSGRCEKGNGLKAAPNLNAISLNPGSLNSYLVIWSSVAGASDYTLEVSQFADFSNPKIAFSGSMLFFAVNNQLAGTYWYRVFASNAKDNSPYSNVRSITIL